MNIVSYRIGYALIMVNYLTIKQKEKEKVFFFFFFFENEQKEKLEDTCEADLNITILNT